MKNNDKDAIDLEKIYEAVSQSTDVIPSETTPAQNSEQMQEPIKIITDAKLHVDNARDIFQKIIPFLTNNQNTKLATHVEMVQKKLNILNSISNNLDTLRKGVYENR